jgi:hypothetical protein
MGWLSRYSSVCHPNKKDILNSLIEEISGDFSLNLDPFLRVSRQAGDVVSLSLAADKLSIIITGISNTGCEASTIQELDVETFALRKLKHFSQKELTPTKCNSIGDMGDAHELQQVL